MREVEADVPDYFGSDDAEFEAALSRATDVCTGLR